MNAHQQLEYLRKNLWRFPIEGRPTPQQLSDAIVQVQCDKVMADFQGQKMKEDFPTAYGGYGATNQG